MNDADNSWYEEVTDGSVHQGDMLEECPIIIPPVNFNSSEEGETIDTGAEFYKVVVMSQTCDIVQNKIQFVVVCPFWPLEEYAEEHENYRDDKLRELTRQGNTPGFYMLNESSEAGLDLTLVSFREIYSVPLDVIRYLASNGNHLRIRSPYREHLSHAFGSFFSRIALPVDISRFDSTT